MPGFGWVIFNPLRDFVDKNNKWIGGCKLNYKNWEGSSDTKVFNAIKKLGIEGKIGQRDNF